MDLSTLAFGSIGGYQWLIVLVIAVLIFGRHIPQTMRGLGGGLREFRRGISGDDDGDPPPKP